jgi:hypothetical protein
MVRMSILSRFCAFFYVIVLLLCKLLLFYLHNPGFFDIQVHKNTTHHGSIDDPHIQIVYHQVSCRARCAERGFCPRLLFTHHTVTALCQHHRHGPACCQLSSCPGYTVGVHVWVIELTDFLGSRSICQRQHRTRWPDVGCLSRYVNIHVFCRLWKAPAASHDNVYAQYTIYDDFRLFCGAWRCWETLERRLGHHWTAINNSVFFQKKKFKQSTPFDRP